MNEKYLYPDDFPREDEVLRRAAEDFDLPFDESYWEQAEKLLDAAAAEEGITVNPPPPIQASGEGTHGRNRYWLLLLLLLFGGCGSWLVWNSQKQGSAQLTTLHTDNNYQNKSNTNNTNTQQSTGSSNNTANNTSSVQHSNRTTVTANNTSNTSSSSASNSSNKNTKVNQSPLLSIKSSNSDSNNKTQSISAKAFTDTKNARVGIDKISADVAANVPPTVVGVNSLPNNANDNASIGAEQSNTISTTEPVNSAANLATMVENSQPALTAITRMAVPLMLEGVKTTSPLTAIPLREVLKPITAQVQATSQSASFRSRLNYTISGGVALFNGVDSSDYNFKKISVSPELGASASFQLNSKVSVQVGARVNYHNQINRTVYRETCNCNVAVLDSIGVQTFSLLPKAVYFLETPIGVRFSLSPRHYLGLSGGIAWRLGMKADVKNFDDVAPRSTYRYDSGASAIAPFVGISYEYAISSHWGIQANVSYRHKWLDNKVFPSNSPIGLWGGGVSVLYHFR